MGPWMPLRGNLTWLRRKLSGPSNIIIVHKSTLVEWQSRAKKRNIERNNIINSRPIKTNKLKEFGGSITCAQGYKDKGIVHAETIIMEDETKGNGQNGLPIIVEVPKSKPKGITTPFLWNENYGAKIYASTRLLFGKDFPNNFKVASRARTKYLSNMVESYML